MILATDVAVAIAGVGNNMVTVGLVKELLFISTISKLPVEIELRVGSSTKAPPILILVFNNFLNIYYKKNHIWAETIDGPTAFFGIESADAISRIIACVDNGSPWEQYRYVEKA